VVRRKGRVGWISIALAALACSAANEEPGESRGGARAQALAVSAPLVQNGSNQQQFLYHQLGTAFSVGGAELASTAALELYSMMATVDRVDFLFQSGGASSAELTLSGLLPNIPVYVYQGNSRNVTALVTSPEGKIRYVQALSGGLQQVWVLAKKSTLFLDSTQPRGGDCETLVNGAPLGQWNSGNSSCQLLQDVDEHLELLSSSVTLDCKDPNTGQNHRVVEASIAGGTNRTRVFNCTFTSPIIGLQVFAGATDVVVRSSTFVNTGQEPRAFALTVVGASSLDISENVFEGPFGVLIRDSSDAGVRDNTFHGERAVEVAGALSADVTVFGSQISLGRAQLGAPVGIRIGEGATHTNLGFNDLDGPLASSAPLGGLDDGIGILTEGPDTTFVDLRGNHVRNFGQGLSLAGELFAFDGGGGVVRENRIVSNQVGISLFTRTYAFTLNDIHDNARKGLSTAAFGLASLPALLELSDNGAGNYWGRPCPGPPLFVAGEDSNDVLAVDSNPFGVPVTEDSSLPAADFIAAGDPGCQLLDTDGDGLTPQQGDCDDSKQSCTSSCTDLDGDGVCNGDCADNDPRNFPGNVEACDGADNDCDGLIDEDFANLGAACTLPGACGSGVFECFDGGTRCSSARAGKPEACNATNGLDDDCDGQVDNPVPCSSAADCGSGVLECFGGNRTVCSVDPGGSAFSGNCGAALDTDGDGITDRDEIFGIDANDDGVPEVNLPAFGANPLVSDVFVEVDRMPGRLPSPDIFTRVVDAFAARGIVLHVDLGNAAPGTSFDLGGGNEIPRADIISFGLTKADCPDGECLPGGAANGLSFLSFDSAKAANFDSIRLRAFHYAIYAEATSGVEVQSAAATVAGAAFVDVDSALVATSCGGPAEIDGDHFTYSGVADLGGGVLRLTGVPTSGPDAVGAHPAGVRVSVPDYSVSGTAEIFGDDFYVVSGANTGCAMVDIAEAGTFMHELGHNLGLRHGGVDNVNFKPNYLSVMNYSFSSGVRQFEPGTCNLITRRLDYSDRRLPALDESHLVEAAGISGGADDTRYSCGGVNVCAQGDAPIDWNCDGDSGRGGDICGAAGLPPCDVNGSGISVLQGYDDWSNLQFAYRGSGLYGNVQHGDLPDLDPAQPFDARRLDQESSSVAALVPLDVRLLSQSVHGQNDFLKGIIDVTVFGNAAFKPAQDLNRSRITFGKVGTEAAPIHFQVDDANRDGIPDLVCAFRAKDTALTHVGERGVLSAMTGSGSPITGAGSVELQH